MGADASLAATRAFVEAMGELGNHYHGEYEDGNRGVISVLTAEEPNLLHARRLARSHGWWDPVTSAMQGLRSHYGHTGRRAEWSRLVEEITPDFVDPATDGPLPGREEQWSLVTEYRVLMAEERRTWTEAERLQHLHVDWNRQRAEEAVRQAATRPDAAGKMPAPQAGTSETLALRDGLQQVVGNLTDAERNTVRSLAVSVEMLGHIQRGRQESGCVEAYQESLDFYEIIGDRSGAAACAFKLGHAYMVLPEIRDLAQAERWYRRSLRLFGEADSRCAQCLGQLGAVALGQFDEARSAGRPEDELIKHLNAALESYHQALKLLPKDAVNDLAVTHNELGRVYAEAGDMDRALQHWREAIRLKDASGDVYGAATTRFNVALALAQSGRLVDAREYALAALRDYQTYGDAAAAQIEKTKRLVADIEKDLASS